MTGIGGEAFQSRQVVAGKAENRGQGHACNHGKYEQRHVLGAREFSIETAALQQPSRHPCAARQADADADAGRQWLRYRQVDRESCQKNRRPYASAKSVGSGEGDAARQIRERQAAAKLRQGKSNCPDRKDGCEYEQEPKRSCCHAISNEHPQDLRRG